MNKKQPRIIDADEAIGPCDMNYNFKLVGYQIRGRTLLKVDKSPKQLERQVNQGYKYWLSRIK